MMIGAGRSILISGCSSGIGEAAALTLQQRGYRVFAGVRRLSDGERLRQQGITTLPLDITQAASIEAALTTLLAATGGTLDALFNNAGYGQPGAVEDLTTDQLRAQFETNLFGTHELTRQVVAIMRQQGYGRIVVNSSLLGYVALPFRGAYNASKFALEGLFDTLRLELRLSGAEAIHLVLLEPGPIRSQFRANALYHYQQAAIDTTGSPFRDSYPALERRLAGTANQTPFTLPATAVVQRLITALEARSPRARYRITLPSHLFALLRWLLPTSLLDRLLLAVARGELR